MHIMFMSRAMNAASYSKTTSMTLINQNDTTQYANRIE